MCGIAGILNFNKPEKVDEITLKKMLARIHHRGPDERGIYVGKKVGLGNVRLSIIDLATGQQPMSNADGSFWIVYNGEVFNYIELREELLKKGHTFKTTCDTEIVVHLYEEYGESFLEKLNGQFAIAIWDKKKEELFLARDRVGIRPVFYTEVNGSFIFGSEIKSILEFNEVQPELDYKALEQVFTFWTTITPNTVFKNIYELSPGHYMKVNARGKTIRRYWQLGFPDNDSIYKGSIDDAVAEFHDLFEDAVRIRLRADVPVAAYLSGGIDSSVTTAFIKNVEPSVLQTFSIGFADKDFDETLFQHEVSQYLGTQHKSFICTSKEIAKNFPSVVYHSEIPLIRTAPTPMYSLSKLVRQNNIKVVITGEGADEVLAGYDIFKETKIRHFWAKYPQSKYRSLLLKNLYPYIPQISNANSQVLKFFFGYKLNETDNPFYSHLLRWNNGNHIIKHLNPNLQKSLNGYDPMQQVMDIIPEDFEKWEPMAKAQYLETVIFMSGYLLSSQGDRVAMANSVEGRYPFLDYRVIEFCSKLPADFKMKGLTEKFLLKRMMKDKLPQSVLKRSKQAYRAPIASTFLSKEAPAYVMNHLSHERIKQTGIFNTDTVLPMIDKMKNTGSSSEIENMVLAGVLSTQLFIEQYIERKVPVLKKEEYQECKVISER